MTACTFCGHPESAHSPDGCARQITTREGVQDCPCARPKEEP